MSSVTCHPLEHFSTLTRKGHDFPEGGGDYLAQNMYFDFLYKFCPKIFSLLEELSEM